MIERPGRSRKDPLSDVSYFIAEVEAGVPVVRADFVPLFAEERNASIHNLRIELFPATGKDLIQSSVNTEGWSVRPVRTHCLNHIRNRKNSGFQQSSFGQEPLGIAGAVRPLVMLVNHIGDRPRKMDRLDDLGSPVPHVP